MYINLFKTKKLWSEAIQAILQESPFGRLEGEPLRILLETLKFHPDYEDKVGQGIRDIVVAQGPIYGGRCFWITRQDGSISDFSYSKCINHAPKG